VLREEGVVAAHSCKGEAMGSFLRASSRGAVFAILVLPQWHSVASGPRPCHLAPSSSFGTCDDSSTEARVSDEKLPGICSGGSVVTGV